MLHQEEIVSNRASFEESFTTTTEARLTSFALPYCVSFGTFQEKVEIVKNNYSFDKIDNAC